MKQILMIAVFAVGACAMAQEGTTGHEKAGQATTQAPQANTGKVDAKTARAECLKEKKGLKGAKLKECIKSKTL